MADVQAWWLDCCWCSYRILVNARGGRGADQGSGFEAARLMQAHVEGHHGRSWFEYLVELRRADDAGRVGTEVRRRPGPLIRGARRAGHHSRREATT